MKEYFNIEMVAVIKDVKDNIIGFRIVDGTVASENGKRPTKEVSITNMLDVLKKNPSMINNLEVSKDKIVGTNGKLERYTELVLNNGVIDKKSSNITIVVLGRVNDKYFEVSDCSGNCKLMSEKELIDWASSENNSIANASIVNNTDGTKYIRSLSGEFKNIIIENKKEKQTTLTKPKVKVEVKPEVKDEIEEEKEMITLVSSENNGNGGKTDYELITKRLDGELTVIGIEPNNYTGIIVIPKKIKRIGLEAFKDTYISGVIMEDGVVDVGKGAFYNCKYLANVRVSNNVKFIGANCFSKCHKLSRVIIGKGVERIHECAFEDCTALTTINIPSNVTEIASNAFRGCKGLSEVKHNGSIHSIGQSAFRGCKELKQFDFKGVYTIGSHSFRNSGLENILITGDTYTIGNYAFFNCVKLKAAEIQENVTSLGEKAFNRELSSKIKEEYHVEKVLLPKSLQDIGIGAFNNETEVGVYYGTDGEAFCKTFELKIFYRDNLDESNSTKARRRANAFGLDGAVCSNIRSQLAHDKEGNSNPEYELDTSKLISIEIIDELLPILKIENAKDVEPKEPKIKFKALCNLITKTSKVNGTPLTTKVFRFKDTLEITNREVYSDGYNRIYKVRYRTIDILKEGVYWLVLQGNTCRYITELTPRNNFRCYRVDFDNDVIPIDMIRTGDSLGVDYSISGETIRVSNDEYLGKDMLERIERNALSIKVDSKNILHYIPALDKAVHIIDEREYDKDNKLKEDCANRVKVKGTISYKEFMEKISKISKANMNYEEYFNELRTASDAYAKYMSDLIKIVPEERISQLYEVAKKYKKKFGTNNAGTNITKDILEGIINSYWVVEKDVDWFNSVGKKSLNKIGVYKCEDWSIVEYKSNQVIKFSNPYISGGKGAYVFTVLAGNQIIRVLSSDRTFENMVKDIKEILDYNDIVDAPELMTKASVFERVDKKYFYDFYDVVYSKNGWSMNNIKYNQFSVYTDYECYVFHISMYKPTGVMYLTTNVFKREKYRSQNGKEGYINAEYVVPLFKIGDLDRALYVAATTNTKAKDTKLKEELLYLSYVIKQGLDENKFNDMKVNRQYLYDSRYAQLDDVYRRYIKARQLTIDGVSDIKAYNMVDERLIWMIGTKASGKIKPADRIYSLSKYDLNINK